MYRPRSTLEQWRILQAVVDHGGYAHAADVLNKSQSSLNHAVAKLQQQLGVQLLEVKGRKAYLTEAGEVMLRRSRHLTQNVQDLETLATSMSQCWEPEVTLAVDLPYPKTLLHPALQIFAQASRGSRLKIIDTVLTGTEEAVTEAWADLVISHHVPKGHLGEPIAKLSFVPVCHPDHHLAAMPQPIDPNELQQHLQLVIKDTSKTPNEKQGWLKSESRWTMSHFVDAIELIEAGMGFCWIPEHLVQEKIASGRLFKFEVAGSSQRWLISYLICPRPDNMGPCSRMLADAILANKQDI